MNYWKTVKSNVLKDYESLEDIPVKKVFAPEGGWRIKFLRQKKVHFARNDFTKCVQGNVGFTITVF